ncbi:bidirectional sugar transporter SWEET5-like isoform X2 [Apium graveolens]|uniref:bidirectional sugar transporter SWEET5-like isoform X2 n=1 Tax=Apium graveolens TaxID=4045 RepID=UPI003D79F58D
MSSLLACLLLRPFYRAIKKKSSGEELNPEYCLLTTMTCLFWALYGTPSIDPGSILVLTANGIGVVMNLAYLIIFLIYAADNKQRIYVGGVLCLELVLVGLVGGLVIRLAHTVLAKRAIVGGFGIYFFVIMCWPRVSKWVPICINKNFGDMCKPLVVTNIFKDLCWIIYAVLKCDIFLSVTHIWGLIVGVVEFILYRVYDRNTSKVGDYEKVEKVKVQLRQIDAGKLHKKLATKEAQPQKRDTCDSKLVVGETQLEEIVTK